jgi:hypothetical protein
MGPWLDLAWSAAAVDAAFALIAGTVALWVAVKIFRRVFREMDGEAEIAFPHVGMRRPKR